MANTPKLHVPSWIILPYNNDRTGYAPVGFPVVLSEPDRIDGVGNGVANSAVVDVRIAIENVAGNAIVAGHDHVGLIHPNEELFAVTVSRAELAQRLIDVEAYDFFNSNGNLIDVSEAKLGDYFQYTSRTGVRDIIYYNPTANYYDLSDKLVDVDTLQPGRYRMSYQARYYQRILSSNGEQLICIDANKLATAAHGMSINHPGEILQESIRLTPTPYINSEKLYEDPTTKIYRPLTDALQNVYDEQVLLGHINWVNKIEAQYIPYLSYLLGLDIPYFPNSLDRLRRTTIKNLTRIQQLKGSRRALVELLDLFGFATEIVTLYSSRDGAKFIRPGESQPTEYKQDEITVDTVWQAEPVLYNYNTDGFGQLAIPLLYNPSDNDIVNGVVTNVKRGSLNIVAYLVEKGSTSDQEIVDIVDAMDADPSKYGETVNGMLPAVDESGIVGYNEILIDIDNGESSEISYGGARPPFNSKGFIYNKSHNSLIMTFDGALDFESDSDTPLALHAFVVYRRQDIVIPEPIRSFNSNRFNVHIIEKETGAIQPDVINFVASFLFKSKAFHSILNIIAYPVSLSDTYLVTDLCLGGQYDQRPDTSFGMLQVPPAIVPESSISQSCDVRPETLGYKQSDINYRNRIITDITAEFESWKRLDGSDGSPNSDSRITPNEPMGSECQYTKYGQDRIIVADDEQTDVNAFHPNENANAQSLSNQSNLEEYPHIPTSNHDASIYARLKGQNTIEKNTHCETNNVDDYCYRGRVSDVLLAGINIANNETYHNHDCEISIGHGLYYSMPVIDKKRDPYSYLGRLQYPYNHEKTQTLHYVDGIERIDDINKHPSTIRTSLGIDKNNMFHPGCRFITMDKLPSNFISDDYRAKPWDDLYSSYCNETGGCSDPSFLNATLTSTTDAYDVLSYDDAPYKVLGNGGVSDITNLSTHVVPSGFSEIDLVHSVYGDAYPDLFGTTNGAHESITLDFYHASNEDIIVVGDYASSAIFKSARSCGEGSGGTDNDLSDYLSGYPAEYGAFDYAQDDTSRSGLYDDLFEAMGIPENEDDTGTSLLFTCNTGLRVGMGQRLGCACVSACDDDNLGCTIESESDYRHDRITMTEMMLFNDMRTVEGKMLDGTVTSLFSIVV